MTREESQGSQRYANDLIQRAFGHATNPYRAHKGSQGPQEIHRGARGTLPQVPENRGKLGKPFFKRVLGETSLPKHLLENIQSILVAGNPLIPNLGTLHKQNRVFPTPIFGPKTFSGRSRQIPGPNSGSGSKHVPRRPKTKKMRTENPCRTLVPNFQMEPYGASYGQKPFLGKPS